MRTVRSLSLRLLLLCALGVIARTSLARQSEDPPAILLHLAEASSTEAEALNRLSSARQWPARALAVMRLERYDCEASAGRLLSFTADPSWRVRAYAFACLARRGIVVPLAMLEAERDPRVVRTILRGHYALGEQSINAKVASIEKSPNLYEACVALEILATIDRSALDARARKALTDRMDELLTRIVLRMTRTEGGALASRLEAITNGPDSSRNYRWREWHRKTRADRGWRDAAIVPSTPSGTRLLARNRVANLSTAEFSAFETYLASIAQRPMDLAILIDCTASMGGELGDAQSNIDELVDFLGSVTAGLRLALVGYRDHSGDWETKAWDFTTNLLEARTRLWTLTAEGGGDAPESVHAAIKLALTQLTWTKDPPAADPQPIRACVLVGDAPPHVGEGTLCVNLAKRGFAAGVRFYGIIARDHEKNLKSEDEGDGPATTKPDAESPPETAPPSDPNAQPSPPTPTQPDETPRKGAKNPGGTQIAPPRAPLPVAKKATSYTWFPEICEAGGGRAEILKAQDSLVAEIAELTIADKYRAEFSDFFAAFRVLCR